MDSPGNISVGGGVLKLTSRKEVAPFACGSKGKVEYSSGSVMSKGKWAQAFGRFEIRAKMPASKQPGLHSALWMWPEVADGQWAEIDIAEFYTTYPDRAIPYIHYLPYLEASTTNNYCMVQSPEAWHTYVAEWTREGITIKYDGVTCVDHKWRKVGAYQPPAPFDRDFFMVLTQGLGVDGTGNAFRSGVGEVPASLVVDYVRAWK